MEARMADWNPPQQHVWRARRVLLSGEGLGTHAIMRGAGVSKTAGWRWHDRFGQDGVGGLLRDKTRPARIPPLGPEVALSQEEPPGETTPWTAAAMSKVAATSVSSVQRIWRGHGLQPHRVRQFKLSTDPAFADKLR
ncbi:IS630 family transposase, partial [Methylobacterium sp. J-043]|nr:IS630 family transposase [Methylobacterium sp. J-043]